MRLLSEKFFNERGEPVDKHDPAAVTVEIQQLDDDGEVIRTYASLGPQSPS